MAIIIVTTAVILWIGGDGGDGGDCGGDKDLLRWCNGD